MQYLTLSANYMSFLKDDFEPDFNIADLQLPGPLLEHLENWWNTYREIIPLSHPEREDKLTLINNLVDEGIHLAKELQTYLDDVKIKYFSEGLLTYLPI
ncbi:hypothetical protein ACE38W_09915 [Chitinophaga sp. Hz27]|uniref:hypothetical protein n=1 Tax=Chitinophaga sp. Hz27 TaxID=3347169 RepID=UPI0035DEAA67